MATTINQRTRRAHRFGGGVSTLSPVSRVAYTVVVTAVGALLVRYLLLGMQRPDTRVSGLLMFLIGVWAVTALLTLPYVWRSSAEWQRDRLQAYRLQRELQASFDSRIPRHLAMARLQPACEVCGQDGTVLLSARTQCTACQRPWLARAS
jgi:hypothetical protein